LQSFIEKKNIGKLTFFDQFAAIGQRNNLIRTPKNSSVDFFNGLGRFLGQVKMRFINFDS